MTPYPYQPLGNLEDIRILTISPGQYEDPITCSLTHMSLVQDVEPYEALSYCWSKSVTVDKVSTDSELVSFSLYGDGLDQGGQLPFKDLLDHQYLHQYYIRCGGVLPAGTILCDGTQVSVNGELLRAIKRLRNKYTSLRIWIDAICINQSDIMERNQQVRIMGSVYKRAACVRIWLGEEIGIEPEALGVLETAEKCLMDAIEQGSPAGVNPFNTEWQLVKDARLSNLAWESLTIFCSRAWFQRIWVIQEVVNSANATVHIGNFVLPWDWLSSIISAARSYKMDRVLENDDIRAICMMDWLKRVKNGDDPSSISLLDALEETRTFQSTVASDKIYGVLGLVDQAEDVLVDYALDAGAVFKHFTVEYLTKRRSLDILYHCVNPKVPSSIDLPSWVADWTAPGWVEPFRSRRLPAKAAGDTEVRLTVDGTGEVLSIWGKLVDTIALVDTIKSIPSSNPPDSIGSWHAAEVVSRDEDIAFSVQKSVDSNYRNTARDQHSWVNAKDSLKAILDIAYSGLTPTAQLTKALAQTFMCNRTRYGHEVDESCSLGLDAFIASTLSDEGTEKSLRAMVDHQIQYHALDEEHATEYHRKLKEAFESFTRSHTKWCHNRRFFRTTQGHFGWGVHGIQADDVVSIFCGGDYPFILRKQEDGRYKIVGDCYIHGFMDGQGVLGTFPDNIFHII